MTKEESPTDTSTMKFFAIIGVLTFAFGTCVALFDIMYYPVLSALLGVMFIVVGSTCLMIAIGKFLRSMDDRYN